MRLLLAALLVCACGDGGGSAPPDAAPDAGVCDPSQSCDDGDACTSDHRTASCTCAHDPIPNCCGNGVVEGNDGTLGCDLDGNGSIDNAFGGALNQTARANFSDIITSQDLEDCDYAQLFRFTSSDITMRDFFHLTMVSGIGTESPPNHSEYFTGDHMFYVTPDFLDAGGRPTAAWTARRRMA